MENPAGRPLTWVRTCARCGYQGYGDHYFAKLHHVALLVVLGLATSGVGALIYWLMRHRNRLCPRCGLDWRHASYQALPHPDSRPQTETGSGALLFPMDPRDPTGLPPSDGSIIHAAVRIGGGAFLGFMGIGWITGAAGMMGVVAGFMPLWFLGAGVAASAGGAGLIWSGLRALWGRRGARTDRLRRTVLRLAGKRGGRLTATEVAAYLDLPLTGARELLDGMELEDSLYVRSEVTDEGVIVYEFPELLRRPGRKPEGMDRMEGHEEL